VTVNVTQLPDDNAQFTARVAANNPPDVLIGVWGYEPAKYAKAGKLVNLDTMPGAKELVDRIAPEYIHRDFGGLYYIPWNATTQMLIYNKQLFEEAGIKEPPKTWDEYLEVARKISELPPRPDGTKVYGNVFWNEALAWGGWYWTMLAQIYYKTASISSSTSLAPTSSLTSPKPTWLTFSPSARKPRSTPRPRCKSPSSTGTSACGSSSGTAGRPT